MINYKEHKQVNGCFLGGNGVLNCVPSLGSTWLKTEEVTDRKQLHAFTKHPWSSPETKQFSVANTKSRNVGRCCINVLESQCLLYGLDQASVDQFKLPYNGISNAPVYMKINKSVKQNIKCTLLLLIPKEINGSFYDIRSIKRCNGCFTTVSIHKLVSCTLLLFTTALWMENSK